MRRTRGSHIPGTSQDEDDIPDSPPVPPNLADAMDPGVILADDSESEEEEEEDPESIMRAEIFPEWIPSLKFEMIKETSRVV